MNWLSSSILSVISSLTSVMSPSAMPLHDDAVALHTRRHQQKIQLENTTDKGSKKRVKQRGTKRTSGRPQGDISSTHAPILAATSSSETSSLSSSPSSSPPSSPHHNRGWQSGFEMRHLQIVEREVEEDGLQEFVASIVPTPKAQRDHATDDDNNARRRRTRRSSGTASPLLSPLKPPTRNGKKRKLAAFSDSDSLEKVEGSDLNRAVDQSGEGQSQRRAHRPSKKVRIVSPPSLALLEGNESGSAEDSGEKENQIASVAVPPPIGVATRRSSRTESSVDTTSSAPRTHRSRKTSSDSRKRKSSPPKDAKKSVARSKIKKELVQSESRTAVKPPTINRKTAPMDAKPPARSTQSTRGSASAVESRTSAPVASLMKAPTTSQPVPARTSSRVTAQRNSNSEQRNKVDRPVRATQSRDRSALVTLQPLKGKGDGDQEVALGRPPATRRKRRTRNDNMEVLTALEATMHSVEVNESTPSISGLRKRLRLVESEKTITCIVVMRKEQEDPSSNQQAAMAGSSYASLPTTAESARSLPPPPPPHFLNVKSLLKEYEDVCCKQHGTCLRLPHSYGSTPQAAVGAIDDMVDDLLNGKDDVEEDEDYVLDRQLYKRSERDNKRNLDRDRIEKLKEQEKLKEHFLQLAYNSRSKKQHEMTATEIEMNAFVSRPIRFDASRQSVGSRSSRRQEVKKFGGCTLCPLAAVEEPCPLCRHKGEKPKSKPLAAPADNFMRPLFRQIDVDAPEFNRRDDEQDEVVAEVDIKPKDNRETKGRQKRSTRNHICLHDDKKMRTETVLKLQDMKHSIAFIEAFNRGMMTEIPKENRVASRM